MHDELELVLEKLRHQHELLHTLLHAVADISAQLAGGMSPAEVQQVTARLKGHAARLEAIAASSPAPAPPAPTKP